MKPTSKRSDWLRVLQQYEAQNPGHIEAKKIREYLEKHPPESEVWESE